MLLGRDEECRRVSTFLESARGGEAQVLLVQGEAGIGKSALLGFARERAAGMTCLDMTGVESETELAFAGLTELLRPVLDDLEVLVPDQAEALQGALALNAEPANPLTVRVALLSLLAALAEDEPVLVAVDDAQWLDQSSLEALSFAMRRLQADRVGVLVAARADWPIALAVPPEAELHLGALPERAARQLLSERSRLNGPAADRVLDLAAGNPLALLELPDVLGTVPAPTGVEPLPVGARVRAAFQHRLDLLPEATRLAVGVVAADDRAALREILAAFGHLALGPDALHPAEAEGLVTVQSDTVALRHPLLRSVAYHALTAPQRRQVHAALADVVGDGDAGERRTWHRAAAALGPDEEVAKALEEVARAAERRGALATVAHGYTRAASLSEDDDARARRLHDSAETWLVAGHWEVALEQFGEAAAYAVDPGLRADIAASTGQLEAYRAGPGPGTEILVDAAERIEDIDPGRATRLYAYAVSNAVFALDVEQAVSLAERAHECGERAGGLNTVAGSMARVEAGLLTGDPSVRSTLEPLGQLAEAVLGSDLEHAEHVVSLVALADFVLEDFDRADRLLETLVRRAHETGRLFLLAFALAVRTELDFRRGRWKAAYDGTTDVLETQLLPGVGSWVDAVQARVEAGLGLGDDAEARATRALRDASATGTYAVAAWAGSSLGFLELGRGHPQHAIEHLEGVAHLVERGGVEEPGILWWAGDLIEAYWRVGDIGAARRRTELLTEQAVATGRRWAHAVAARSAGLLAATASEMEDAFARALSWHARLHVPFEEARTLLLLGERRLSIGLDDADKPLRGALAAFERIGAEPWIGQARVLLGMDEPEPELVSLTKQERQVAAIVGQGLTNREAADALFLSPRTIDFHLRNIYKKVGVRSRTELAVWMGAQQVAR